MLGPLTFAARWVVSLLITTVISAKSCKNAVFYRKSRCRTLASYAPWTNLKWLREIGPLWVAWNPPALGALQSRYGGALSKRRDLGPVDTIGLGLKAR